MIKLSVGDKVKIDVKMAGYTEPISPEVIVVVPIVNALVTGFWANTEVLSTGAILELYFRREVILEIHHNRNTLAELGSVVQDFIDSRDITIENPEKQLNGLDQHPTTIYGSDWDELIENFESVLNSIGIDFKEDYS